MTVVTVTTYPGCCCPPDVHCECTCCSTPGFWSQYPFTIAGIINNAGAFCDGHCSDLNGSWTPTYFGGCYWATRLVPETFCATPSGPFWSLSCSAGTWRMVGQRDGNDVHYESTAADFCLNGGVMTRVGTVGLCDGYPATITVGTGGVFTPCP